MATLEMINAMLNSKHSLFKRNGQPNEANIAIMKRLHDITPAEIEKFKREDEGWNWTPAEKHERGYHSLRALDRWYKKNGHGSGSDGTDYDKPSNDNGFDPFDGFDGDGSSNGNGSNADSSGNGNGDGAPSNGSDNDNGNGNGNGDSGSDSNGNSNGNGDDANGDGSGSNEDGSGSGDGNGSEDSDSNGSGDSNGNGDGDSNGDGSNDSNGNGDGNGNADEPSNDSNGTDDKPSDEPKPNKPNKPSEKLTPLEKKLNYIITTPRADGQPNNVYLPGPAGCGKSYGSRELARKMGYGYWETGMFTMPESLLGFKTANGDYSETEFVRILKHGIEGKDIVVVLFDEFDGNSNDVTLPFNNIFASRRFTTQEGTFDVHPSVRFVATGNTTMDGSDENYDRENADKSVKTRWIFLPVTYDKNLEKKLADKETVRFLQGLRKAKDNIGLDLMVTYREFTALDWAEKAINADILTRQEALDSCVFKGLTEDDKDNLRRDDMITKLISEGNRWAVAL